MKGPEARSGSAVTEVWARVRIQDGTHASCLVAGRLPPFVSPPPGT
jgi:hypothetical protein